VFDFLKANSFIGFPMSHIQSFARQLFCSVAFLHDLQLIHTDLKPENILLVDSQSDQVPHNRRGTKVRRILRNTDIRLIDFGSATFESEYHSSVVSTRHYRAPEIILGLPWSFPCDIWSIGCILVEFFTGDALFQTHDNLEHLSMMEVVCGKTIDSRILRRITKRDILRYFVNGRLDYPNAQTSRQSRKYVKAMKSLTVGVSSQKNARIANTNQELVPPQSSAHILFADLLSKIFVYDPYDRITARDALHHPFFEHKIVDEGYHHAAATQSLL